MHFPCTSCGACCRHLPQASSLHAGDGICRHLDPISQRCAIYDKRPLICRVDDLYQERLSQAMSRRVYYLLQAKACTALDGANAGMPQETARLLALEAGGQPPEPLTDEEFAVGLHQVMAVARPLMAAT